MNKNSLKTLSLAIFIAFVFSFSVFDAVPAGAESIQNILQNVSGNRISDEALPAAQGSGADQAVQKAAEAGAVPAGLSSVIDKMMYRYILENPWQIMKYAASNIGDITSDVLKGNKTDIILKYAVNNPEKMIEYAAKNKAELKKNLDWKECLALDFALQNPSIITNYVKNNKEKIITNVKAGKTTDLALDVALQNPSQALNFASNNSGKIIDGFLGGIFGANNAGRAPAGANAGTNLSAAANEAGNAIKGIADGFKGFFGNIVNAFKNIGNTFKKVFKDIGDSFKNIFK